MELSVIVITYNQEDYIEQTIDSIINQETDFAFEIIIGDDASKDSTRNILLKYKEKYSNIKLILHDENIGINKNFMSVYNASGAKYVAETGGDDYWIDKKKLQKQYDFMQENSEYSLICTGYKRYFQNEDKFDVVQPELDKDIVIDELYHKNPIGATTTMYRKNLIPVLEPSFKDVPVEDWILWLRYAKLGKVRYIRDVSAVYRIHNKSVYASRDDFMKLKWRFDARAYIKKNLSHESNEEFFRKENANIKFILCANTGTKKEKLKFFKEIQNMGYSNKNSWLKTLLTFNSRITNSIIWRTFNMKNQYDT
jgi:glycosyltransferase involved in cell wall biosynthesis